MDDKSETHSDSKSQVGRIVAAAEAGDTAGNSILGNTIAAAAEPRAIPGTPILTVAGSVASSGLSSVLSSALSSGAFESPVLTSVEVKASGSPSPTPTPTAGVPTATSPAPSSPSLLSGAVPLAADETKRSSSQSASEKPLKASTPTSSALPTRRHPLPVATRAPSEILDAMVVAVKEDKADSSSELAAQRTPTAVHSSPKSSIALKDEIVVDTKANGRHQTPSNDASIFEPDDLDMEDILDRSPTGKTYPKRKRPSTYRESDDEKLERSLLGDDADDMSTRSGRSSSRSRALAQTQTAQVQPQAILPSQLPSQSQLPPQSHSQSQAPAAGMKNIPLGYWRDSAVPDVKDRHAVIGFMDTRERLRTRIQPTNRSGKNVTTDYPLPPGPGGSWVVFERIVFDRHLVGLDHNQIKEFVKIRSGTLDLHESPEEAQTKDTAAVKEALKRAATHPTPDHLPAPQIAYGEDLPDYMVNANRPEKKRRVASGYGHMPLAPAELAPSPSPQLQHAHPQLGSNNLAPAGSPVASAIQRSVIDLLPGTRPTKILLGYWRGSSEDRLEDKHAVFGILGANDMFRVKVARETRDGRTVMGNFPTGAGALWIHYDEVEFEMHIRHLSRPEVKEYVRVRQRQLDEGERADERTDNETKAVFEAQARVISAGGAAQSTLGTAGRVDTISFASAANLNRDLSRQLEGSPEGLYPPDGRSRREYQGHELRQTRRNYAPDARDNNSSSTSTSVALSTVAVAMPPAPARTGRHSLPSGASPELRAANRLPSSSQGGSSTENGSGNSDRVERTNSLARREIARVETIQMRNEQRAANREAAMAMSSSSRQMSASNGSLPTQSNGQYGDSSGRNGSVVNGSASSISNGNGVNANGGNSGGGSAGNHSNGTSSRIAFNENIGRLNKVWEAQEASRRRAGGEDAKMYNGVKYERKQTGPFQGKLVSPGAILSIDGEDYVEYRVLTKPTFF